MKKKTLLLLLILSGYSAFAQPVTWLGAGIGCRNLYSTLSDPGQLLQTTLSPGLSYEFLLAQEFSNRIIVESGFRVVQYNEILHWKNRDFWTVTSTLNSFQIPLRVKYAFPLYADKLYLTSFLGYDLSVNRNFNPHGSDLLPNGRGSGKFISETDSLNYVSLEYTSLHRMFSQMETGLTFSYRSSRGWECFLTGSYSQGFSKLMEQDILYARNDESAYNAQSSSKGSGFEVIAGVSYPISTLWQNRTQQQKNRAGRLEALQAAREARWYLSLESGFTRNYFSHNQPEIVPGFESYVEKDHSWGVALGYQFTPCWFVESGYSFDLFWNRYVLREEEEWLCGQGFRYGGQGFRQIPLKVKYAQTFAQQRLAVVPYLGASLITHRVTQAVEDSSLLLSTNLSDGFTDTLSTASIAYRDKKAAPLLLAGIGVEYTVSPHLILTMQASYALGFEDINRLHVAYEHQGEEHQGDIIYQGTNWTLSWGIKVPLYRADQE